MVVTPATEGIREDGTSGFSKSAGSSDHSNKGNVDGEQALKSNGVNRLPISAMFLVQFNVHSGYSIEWSKATNENISLKGIEFKSLPSGLHSVEQDVIYFVQPENTNNNFKATSKNLPGSILNGVAVFQQNGFRDSNEIRTRDDVKMFSLGILLSGGDKDLVTHTNNGPLGFIKKPFLVNKNKEETEFKTLNHSTGWEYVEDLTKLLGSFMNSEDLTSMSSFDDFFKANSNYSHNDVSTNSKIPASIINPNISSSQKLKSKPQESSSSTDRNIKEPKNLTPLTHRPRSHHMILGLCSLLKELGPLTFRLWKYALLRKRILIFGADSNELGAKYAYCLSIIAAIPQSISHMIIELQRQKYFENINLLEIRPIFNVGIGDIDWLSDFSIYRKNGFIAVSTDEILLYKTKLYDVAVQLKGYELPNKQLAPEISIISKGTERQKNQRSTVRDYKRFQHLEQQIFEDGDGEIVKERDKWVNLTEPLSWTQATLNGFLWWATAGEKSRMDADNNSEGFFSGSESDDENDNENDEVTEDSNLLNNHENIKLSQPGESVEVSVVGYFQQLTIHLFVTLSNVIISHDEENDNLLVNSEVPNSSEPVVGNEQTSANDISSQENSIDLAIGKSNSFTNLHSDRSEDTFDGFRHRNSDHYSTFGEFNALTYSQTATSGITVSDISPSTNSDNDTIWIAPTDIHEMGLDPYSNSDAEFVIELVDLWFGRQAKIGYKWCSCFC